LAQDNIADAGGVYDLAAGRLFALARPAGIALPQRELAFAAVVLIAFAGYSAARTDADCRLVTRTRTAR